jgi:hypothetical protein
LLEVNYHRTIITKLIITELLWHLNIAVLIAFIINNTHLRQLGCHRVWKKFGSLLSLYTFYNTLRVFTAKCPPVHWIIADAVIKIQWHKSKLRTVWLECHGCGKGTCACVCFKCRKWLCQGAELYMRVLRAWLGRRFKFYNESLQNVWPLLLNTSMCVSKLKIIPQTCLYKSTYMYMHLSLRNHACVSKGQWHTPVMNPSTWEASLGYTAKPCLKKTSSFKRKGNCGTRRPWLFHHHETRVELNLYSSVMVNLYSSVMVLLKQNKELRR